MIDTRKKILIVGIKGAAMAHIAVILKKMGFTVEGADVDERFITDELLEKHGIKVHTHFDIEVVPDDVSHVIFSAAHGGTDNPIIRRAAATGVKVVHQSEFLGDLLDRFETVVAVCGTHGKTTTSSLLAHALIKIGAMPSFLIGAPSFDSRDGSDYDGKRYFVIEADEYGMNPPKDKTPKFHFLKPHHIICTNVDFDHPDVYEDLKAVKNAFSTFLAKRNVVACFDDDVLMDLLHESGHQNFTTYGFREGADAVIINYTPTSEGFIFDLRYAQTTIHGIKPGLFGEKNALNTAAVIVQLLELGFNAESAVGAVTGFTGPTRRMQVVYQDHGITIIDDYAHHPHEIEATVRAVRERFPEARVKVVFQPHTYSRTASLLSDFCTALSIADASYIAPIFASARESGAHVAVNAETIAQSAAALGYSNIQAFHSKEAIAEHLRSDLKSGDVLILMGAGDIYKIAPDIISGLKIV